MAWRGGVAWRGGGAIWRTHHRVSGITAIRQMNEYQYHGKKTLPKISRSSLDGSRRTELSRRGTRDHTPEPGPVESRCSSPTGVSVEQLNADKMNTRQDLQDISSVGQFIGGSGWAFIIRGRGNGPDPGRLRWGKSFVPSPRRLDRVSLSSWSVLEDVGNMTKVRAMDSRYSCQFKVAIRLSSPAKMKALLPNWTESPSVHILTNQAGGRGKRKYGWEMLGLGFPPRCSPPKPNHDSLPSTRAIKSEVKSAQA